MKGRLTAFNPSFILSFLFASASEANKKERMKDGLKAVSLPFILHPSAFILFFALAAAACSPRADDKAARAADPARELFQRNCAVCHGPEGGGREVGTLKVP